MQYTLALVLILAASSALAADWPTWGRTPARNMTSPDANLPSTFDPGKPKPNSEEIDLATTKNIKWIAKLGSQSYGNPTVAAGKIFVGTNNDSPRDPNIKGDHGILLCFDANTGKFLWQFVSPKLAAGKNCDAENVGICSSPALENDRAYLVTNRCEVVALNTKDGSPIWRFDMRDQLGVFPHQMTASSPLLLNDRLYVTTSNGRDWTLKHTPSPNAPALICLDKNTGKLLAQESSGISSRTYLCNWSSPSLARANNTDILLFGAGDGFLYAFNPLPTPTQTLQELWRTDCNPPSRKTLDAKPLRYGHPKGPSEIIATPVFANSRIYIATGQNPEKGDGAGALSCIDPNTGKILWSDDQIGRSLSTAAVSNNLLFIADFSGRVRCLDDQTGKLHWTHDTESVLWSSPVVADNKLYIGNESGTLTILSATKDLKLLAQISFSSPIYSSTVIANRTLFIATSTHLYAIGNP